MNDLTPGKRYACTWLNWPVIDALDSAEADRRIEAEDRSVECGFICTPEEMRADYAGESWSNWICPHCGAWNHPDGWRPVG